MMAMSLSVLDLTDGSNEAMLFSADGKVVRFAEDVFAQWVVLRQVFVV